MLQGSGNRIKWMQVVSAILILKMAPIYAIANYVCPQLSSEEIERHDFGGYTYVFRVKESNKIDNMDVSNVRQIDFQDGRHLCYSIANYVCSYLSSEKKQRHDVGGFTHISRVNESNEMDNMDVGNINHIDFQDGRHLCYCKLHTTIASLRGEMEI